MKQFVIDMHDPVNIGYTSMCQVFTGNTQFDLNYVGITLLAIMNL